MNSANPFISFVKLCCVKYEFRKSNHIDDSFSLNSKNKKKQKCLFIQNFTERQATRQLLEGNTLSINIKIGSYFNKKSELTVCLHERNFILLGKHNYIILLYLWLAGEQ